MTHFDDKIQAIKDELGDDTDMKIKLKAKEITMIYSDSNGMA